MLACEMGGLLYNHKGSKTTSNHARGRFPCLLLARGIARRQVCFSCGCRRQLCDLLHRDRRTQTDLEDGTRGAGHWLDRRRRERLCLSPICASQSLSNRTQIWPPKALEGVGAAGPSRHLLHSPTAYFFRRQVLRVQLQPLSIRPVRRRRIEVTLWIVLT